MATDADYNCMLRPAELRRFVTTLRALRAIVESIRDTPSVLALETEFRARSASDMLSLMDCIVVDPCIIGVGWVHCVEHLETLARMIPVDNPTERTVLIESVRDVEACLVCR